MSYRISYWVPWQIRESDTPRVFVAKDAKEKNQTILTCVEYGYDIEEIRPIESEENQND